MVNYCLLCLPIIILAVFTQQKFTFTAIRHYIRTTFLLLVVIMLMLAS